MTCNAIDDENGNLVHSLLSHLKRWTIDMKLYVSTTKQMLSSQSLIDQVSLLFFLCIYYLLFWVLSLWCGRFWRQKSKLLWVLMLCKYTPLHHPSLMTTTVSCFGLFCVTDFHERIYRDLWCRCHAVSKDVCCVLRLDFPLGRSSYASFTCRCCCLLSFSSHMFYVVCVTLMSVSWFRITRSCHWKYRDIRVMPSSSAK